jgi:hypothetical protein
MRVENCDGRRARTCPCLPAPAVVCAHSNDPMPVSARTYQVLVSQVRVPACVHARASERARGVAHSRCRTYVVPAATTTIRSVPRPPYTHARTGRARVNNNTGSPRERNRATCRGHVLPRRAPSPPAAATCARRRRARKRAAPLTTTTIDGRLSLSRSCSFPCVSVERTYATGTGEDETVGTQASLACA